MKLIKLPKPISSLLHMSRSHCLIPRILSWRNLCFSYLHISLSKKFQEIKKAFAYKIFKFLRVFRALFLGIIEEHYHEFTVNAIYFCFLYCFWGRLPFEAWHHIVSCYFDRMSVLEVILDFLVFLNQESSWEYCFVSSFKFS